MEKQLVPALTAMALAFGAGLLIIPFLLKLCRVHGWFDVADERKIHTGEIPFLGGVGIFLAFMIAAVAVFVLLVSADPERGFGVRYYALLLFGLTFIHFVGVFDDFVNIHAMRKLALQAVAAGLITAGGVVIHGFSVPVLAIEVQFGALAYPITVLWIIGIGNAVNLIDGMDGMAGGVAAFIAIAMLVLGVVAGDQLVTLLSAALLGAVLSFLVFNVPPASIFMGDGGSLFLGYIIAILPIMHSSLPNPGLDFTIPLTLLLIPILDTVSAILRRLRRGAPVHQPDKEHAHHKLLALGLSTRQALLVVYGMSALISGAVIVYVIERNGLGMFLLAAVWIASISAFLFLSRVHRVQVRHNRR